MVSKKSRSNIRKKILLILCAVLSMTVVGNFIISGEIFKKASVSAFDREAFATARGLQTNINSLIEKNFLPYTEIVNCEPLLDSFVEKNENVLYTYTTDEKGEMLYASKEAMEGQLGREQLAQIVVSGIEVRVEDKINEVLYYILPIQEKKETKQEKEVSQVGVLVVAYPRSCITEPLNNLYTSNAILAGVTFACSFLLIFLSLTRWITKPLQLLDKAIRMVSQKGLTKEHLLNIETNDEIGQIAQSFNNMLIQLEDTTVSKNYINSILVNMSEALFVIDTQKRIETVNDAAVCMLGYEREKMQGQSVDMLYAKAEDNPFGKENFEELIGNNKLRNHETEFMTKCKEAVAVSVNWSVLKDEKNNINKYVCTARDITEIKKAQCIMMHQANYDELTGLANRYNLELAIEKILNDTDKKHIFIVIDLDKFKAVNDICGHAAGDRLLKQIAYMLKLAAGENNLVARLGGDEFAIVMYDTDKQSMTGVMDDLLRNIRNYNFTWEGKVFNVGMSIGAYEINRQGLDRLTVFSAADRACYIAKKKGGNRLHIYTDEDKELNEREEEASMMPVITEAFENNRFFLVYQPIVPLGARNAIPMYEVLVRLRTKEGTVLEPEAFLASAERYNKLLLLDKWVIHHFCENYQKTLVGLSGNTKALFSINLSSDALNEQSFFEFVSQEFQVYKVEPKNVCFEITENCAVSHFVDTSTLMSKLKEMGCRLAIDNFGMGLSSFMYLRNLPIDFVKIDGCVIGEIVKSPVDLTVVRTINEIAHLLNIQTIAEDVESKEILGKLEELSIDYAQGEEMGKPKNPINFP